MSDIWTPKILRRTGETSLTVRAPRDLAQGGRTLVHESSRVLVDGVERRLANWDADPEDLQPVQKGEPVRVGLKTTDEA